MLEHWLQPVLPHKIKGFDSLSKEQLGHQITFFSSKPTGTVQKIPLGESGMSLKNTHIALIGIGSEDADAVRSVLYALSFPFSGLNIVDLGNTRKEETSFIIPLIAELLQGGIVPILLGHSEIFTLAQYQAYQSKKGTVNLAMIDEKIRFTPQIKTDSFFLHQILEDAQLFNCSIIGYQTHFTPPSVSEYFDTHNFDLVRLGKSKSMMEDIEPVVRDADLVSFNIAALKSLEAPGQLNPTPSGFFSEEACQIARYAGMSDKLTSFGIYGFHKKLDKNDQTAHVIAQMIWYFIDGFKNRKQDFPISKAFNQLTQYVVHIKEFDFQATFWRSNKSGRWWMEVPLKTRKKHERHRLIPCSYNDYLQACNEDLPDRLLNAYRRFK
jgi:formiminoglutamase